MSQTIEFRATAPIRRSMRWALYFLLFLLAIALLVALPLASSPLRLGIVAGVVLALGWGAERLLRRIPARGDVLARLDARGIASPYLSGPNERLDWEAIDSATVEGHAQARVLSFRLDPLRLQQRGGQAADGARLSLQTLDAAAQESLYEVVAEHLTATHPAALGRAPTRARNELREARELQARLRQHKPIPWVCVILTVLNVLAWAWIGHQGGGWLDTHTLSLLQYGGNTASAVQAGQWWRLLSAMFLHAGLVHLLANMVGLWIAGALLERIFGSRQFLLIYLLSGLAGSVASLYFAAQASVAVGASGAVFGVSGALLVAVMQHRSDLPRLFSSQILGTFGIYVAYSLIQGFTRPNIDNAAHLGGLLAGACLAWLLPERFDPGSYRRLRAGRMALAALAAAMVLPTLAMLAPPAQRDLAGQLRALNELPAIAQEFQDAVATIQREAGEVRAGRLSELEADEASRLRHAPRWQALILRLEAIDGRLPPSAQAHVGRLLTVGRALHEMLAMPSVIVDGKPQPADPRRAAELAAIVERASRAEGERR